jgi:hypothetical protein
MCRPTLWWATKNEWLGLLTSSSFLYNDTRSMFEEAGFTFERTKGAKNTVLRKTVPPG